MHFTYADTQIEYRDTYTFCRALEKFVGCHIECVDDSMSRSSMQIRFSTGLIGNLRRGCRQTLSNVKFENSQGYEIPIEYFLQESELEYQRKTREYTGISSTYISPKVKNKCISTTNESSESKHNENIAKVYNEYLIRMHNTQA